MPEVNQLNPGKDGMINEPDDADHSKHSRKGRSRSERKHSSHHRTEPSIDDKKSRSSKSHSSSRPSTKKMERTQDEVLHWEGDKSEDAAASSSPEIIHSKSKRSRRHRASSRSFGEGLLYSSHHRRRHRSSSSGRLPGEKRRSQRTDSTESLTEYSSHNRKKPYERSMHSFSHGSTKSLKDESSKKLRRKDTMHSTFHGSTKSLKDESSKKSRRKDKHKSHHRQSSRERFDLIPTVASKTSSTMEVGGQESKATRSQSAQSSTESFTEYSSHSRNKKPHQRARYSASSYGSTTSLKDESSNKSKRKQKHKSHHRQSSRERFDLIPTVPSRTKVGGQERENKRSSSHAQASGRGGSTSSSRKSAPAKITSIDFESYTRRSGSSEGRVNATTNGTTRHNSRSSSGRSLRHYTSGSENSSFRRSKRIPITPRIADEAPIPPGPSSFSTIGDGIEKQVKQRAVNPNSNDNNRSGRSLSPEESLDTRPGAQAVSLDGEEFRSALDSRQLLVSQSSASAMSDQSNHQETASTKTSLQATIVDEESHPGVQAIKAENDRLRQSMIADNQRRRQQIANHRQTEVLSTLGEVIEATPAEDNEDTAEETQKRRPSIFGACMCLFLAVASAMGGVFGLNLIAVFAPSKNVPTSSPAWSSPSSPPTITMLYDPPSEEDCLAVENGQDVLDQDNMIVVKVDVGLEIILNKDIARNEWMDQLLQNILVHLIPYLVGCTDDRDPTVPNRYIFGNGNATIDYDDAETCEKETDLTCYPVAVHLDLSVKDDEEISALINLLEMLIGPADISGDSLVTRLDLSDDFNEVVLDDITNTSPTSVSSSSPTDMPSSSPSSMASSSPSVPPPSPPPSFPPLRPGTPRPSLVPVDMPTTDLPSSSPSTRPTLSPSPKPSPPPTLGLTPSPVPGPAIAPTLSPSPKPTPPPTLGLTPPPVPGPTITQTPTPSSQPSYSPSPGPSPSPTSEPSFAPSSALSSLPTKALTPAPTVATSSVPSQAPSHSPTTAPSLEPSESPSTTPSETPSSAPVLGFESVPWGHAASSRGNITSVISDNDFRTMLANSPNSIIFRECNACAPSHQNIFYKRLTQLPPTSDFDNLVQPADFLDLFINSWFSYPMNQLNVDFELYSTYNDALLGTNQWQFCNYCDNAPAGAVGFPRDCGPNGLVMHQWNSISLGELTTVYGGKDEFIFWVEMAT